MAIASEQDRFALLIESNMFQDFCHGHFEDGVHQRDQAHQEKIGASVLYPHGQQLAEAGAGEGSVHQFAGLVFPDAQGRHQADPAADLPLTEQRQSVADRGNFIAEAETGEFK